MKMKVPLLHGGILVGGVEALSQLGILLDEVSFGLYSSVALHAESFCEINY